MRAYRFLCAKYGKIALEEQRLRISRIDQLNDPFEWAPPISTNQHHRHAFEKMKRKMAEDRGVVCFSKNWRNPLLWSHYADSHRGVALGFDLPDAETFPVKYRKSRIFCDWEKFYLCEDYRLEIVSGVLTSKSLHWKYEDEVRFHVNLDHETLEDGNYFIDFSQGLNLKEVIIGPLVDFSISDIKSIVASYSQNVTIRQARLAFRTYDVVQDKSRKS